MNEETYPDPYRDCRPLPKEEKSKESTGDEATDHTMNKRIKYVRKNMVRNEKRCQEVDQGQEQKWLSSGQAMAVFMHWMWEVVYDFNGQKN